MIVDVWSDVICPYCYLGQRQLRVAIGQFEHGGDVVIRHHAFELDPKMDTRGELRVRELVATKYSLDPTRVDEMHERLNESARALDMAWQLDAARPTNTLDAHRLIALARQQGRDDAMVDRLFRAYFCDGELVSDLDTLLRLADEIGVEGAASILARDELTDDVRGDEAAAQRLGFSGVPSMIFDNRFVVTGAQGTATMLRALREAWVAVNV